MTGHKLQGSHGSYSRPTDEQLLKQYKKAYENLRIEPVLVSTKELEFVNIQLYDVKEENMELKKTVKLLQTGMTLMNEKIEEQNIWRKKVEKVVDLDDPIPTFYGGHGGKKPVTRKSYRQEIKECDISEE